LGCTVGWRRDALTYERQHATLGFVKKRVTLYLDERIQRVLKLRAAQGGSSMSDTVAFAVESFLAIDAEEQATLEKSRRQAARGQTVAYEDAVAQLRRDGLL
jgi:hypothetical protein